MQHDERRASRGSTGIRRLAAGLAATAAGTLLFAGWAAVTVRAASERSVAPCSVSVWAGGYMTDVIVVTPTGTADIPVGTIAVGHWNTDIVGCPTPTAGSLTVRVAVGPPDSGRFVDVGEQTIALDVSRPGRLRAAGRGSDTVVVPIDIGQLDAAAGLEARVTALCSVTFDVNDRAGAVVTNETDLLYSIAEPAPTDATQPRLRMQALAYEAPATSRPGDQLVHHVLLVNNDPDEFAVLDVTAVSRQISGEPDSGDRRGVPVHGITPENGRAFPIAFLSDLDQLQLLSLIDPPISATRSVDTKVLLAPGEARILSIATRAFGSSPDGAACAVDVLAEGRFADGSEVYANLTRLHVVDNGSPTHTPLFEVEDTIGAANRVQAAWGALVVNDDPLLATHCEGNDPSLDVPAFVLNGAGLTLRDLDSLDHPSMSTALLRTEFVPTSFAFTGRHADHAAARDGVPVHDFGWSVLRLPPPGPGGLEFELPAMVGGTTSGVDFELDRKKSRLRSIDRASGDVVGQARIEDLRLISIAVPQGLTPDNDTTRRIAIRPPADTAFDLRPRAWNAGAPSAEGLFVFDDTDGSESVQLTTTSRAVGLDAAAALAGGLITPYMTNVPVVPAPPEVAFVLAQPPSQEARAPIVVPTIALGTFNTAPPEFAPPPEPPKAKFKVAYKKPEKPRDSMKLSFLLPVPENFDAQGAEVFVDIAGRLFRFVMERNGKQQVPDPTATFRIKIKGEPGAAPAQNLKATLKLKRQDLSGLLADFGVWDVSRGSVPATFPVRVLVRGEGIGFEGLFAVRSKRGKFAKGKLAK